MKPAIIVPMNNNVIIEINSGEKQECPFCGDEIDYNADETCPKKISSHKVCQECHELIKEKWFQEKKENCLYCADRPKIEKKISIAPNQVTIYPIRNNSPRYDLSMFCFLLIILGCIIMSYYLLNGCYTIGTLIFHSLFESHKHTSPKMSLKHAFFGLIIWITFSTFCTLLIHILALLVEKIKLLNCKRENTNN